jgi:hypothetical protein
MRMMTAAAVLVSTGALADTTTHYTVLFQDRPSGSQVTTVRADGQVDVDMSYRGSEGRLHESPTIVRLSLAGPTTSEPLVGQLLPQPLRQLQPVAEVPAISAPAANDSLSVWFRMAARSAAKLLPEPQRGSVLAVVAGCSGHFC